MWRKKMAKKDVYEYFEVMRRQYFTMKNMLSDFEAEAAKGLVDLDKVEQIRSIVAPFKANYDRLAYIIYLMDKPKNKKPRKQKKRDKLKAEEEKFKLLNATKEQVASENEAQIEKVKGVLDEQ
jgi:hypothetical protein